MLDGLVESLLGVLGRSVQILCVSFQEVNLSEQSVNEVLGALPILDVVGVCDAWVPSSLLTTSAQSVVVVSPPLLRRRTHVHVLLTWCHHHLSQVLGLRRH